MIKELREQNPRWGRWEGVGTGWLSCAVIRERNAHLWQVRLKCGQPQCLLALHKEAQRTKGWNILSGYALLQENVDQTREVKLQGLTERVIKGPSASFSALSAFRLQGFPEAAHSDLLFRVCEL